MASENVRPTRMELLNTKQRLIIAQKGHHLLKTIKTSKIIMLIGDEDELRKTIR